MANTEKENCAGASSCGRESCEGCPSAANGGANPFEAPLNQYSEIAHVIGIVSGKGGQGCSAAVGYSILNKTATLDVGKLMLKYGGGGHKKVGTCQFSEENMEEELPKMLAELVEMSN